MPTPRPLLQLQLDQFLGRLPSIKNLKYVRSPDGYDRAVLYVDERLEVVAIHWPAGSVSPLHGHGESSTLLRVINGSLIEDRYVPVGEGLRFESAPLKAGETGYLPEGSYHRVVALQETWGLHVYGPCLVDNVAPVPDEEVPLLLAAWREAHRDQPDGTEPEYLASLSRAAQVLR